MSFPIFPSKLRKFVRLTPKQAYEGLISLMQMDLGAKKVQSKLEEHPFIKIKLGGAVGVTVNVRIFAEDGACTLEFSFTYRRLLYLSLIVLITVLGLSLFWNKASLVGVISLPFLVYKVNSRVLHFLAALNEFLPRLEAEYARMALAEERKRWQLEPKDTKGLYRRLCEKHVKTWGDTHALEYKIAEYERQGLTREEAIRKTAEEEGIF